MLAKKRHVGRKRSALALAAALALVAASSVPANAAIDSRCSATPLIPYKSGAQFAFGGTVSCSASVAIGAAGVGQRQGTLNWVDITSGSTGSAGTTSLTYTGFGSLNTGTSTYRSKFTGTSKDGGSTTNYSRGVSITK